MDVKKTVEQYLTKNSFSNRENCNKDYSLQGLFCSITDKAIKEYWLNEVYDEELRYAHESGQIHIHDLSHLSAYCVGWNLEDLLLKGFHGPGAKTFAKPAKHLSSALGQVVNFLYTLQGEAAGAQAFSNFDTFLAPFIRYDNLKKEEVKQLLQEFLFNLNVPTRVGFQPPFTNLTLDLKPPKHLRDQAIIIGGEYQNSTYKEYQEEIDLLNSTLFDLFFEGDGLGKIFTFPLITINITKEFDWDNPVNEKIFELAAKYGKPYFTNYINSDINEEDARSMCVLPDTKVNIINNNKNFEITIKELYDNYDNENVLIKTRKGYLPLEEKQKFHYKGKMIEVISNIGKKLTVTLDHPFIILDKQNKLKKIKSKDLKIGMKIIIDNHKDIVSTLEKNCNNLSSMYSDSEIKKFSTSELYFNGNFDEIKEINKLDYDNFVYDVKVNTSLLELTQGSKQDDIAHSFYANDILTGNCCRLRIDNKAIRKRIGGNFSSSPLTGSLGVVTINLPSIAYKVKQVFKDEQKNPEELFKYFLGELMNKTKRSLEIKRTLVEKLAKDNLYPYTSEYLGGTFKRFGQYYANHFSTIGLCGMNEAIENLFGKSIDITSEKGQKFAKDILDFMKKRIDEYSEETGNLYNLEATPAESTAYRFAKIDKSKHPDIITAGEDVPYYTNSTQLPVDFKGDIFETLDLQDELQCKYTGGTVLHLFSGESGVTGANVKKLIKTVFENYKLPYVTYSPTFSICPDHGYIQGEHFKCPTCGKDSLVYSRIVGYYQPVQNWNDGKREEFKDRSSAKIIDIVNKI